MVVYTVMVVLAGCTARYRVVKDAAQKNIDSFSEGNMEEINRLLFGISESPVEAEEGMYEGAPAKERDGILRIVFLHSTMSVKKVGKDRVEFEIIVPDMEDIFKYVPDTDNRYANSQKGFLEYLEDYVTLVERKKSTVSVPYSVEGENIVIDYYNEEFIRAVTGGLADAYAQIYMDASKEYEKGVQ